MARVGGILAGLSMILVGLLFVPKAMADIIYNFTVPLTSGPDTGTLTGTLDLPFVSAGGSGTGAASSLVLTSFPAGFGTLSEGDIVTSWTDQVTDIFTVTAGAVTSFEFMAVTNGDPTVGDYFCINSTGGSAGSFGGWICPADLNELSKTSSIFGYNFGGANGVTFTAVSPAPEPSSISLLGFSGLLLLSLGLLRRYRQN